MNQYNQKTSNLWNALSKARLRPEVWEQEIKISPWESSDSQVKSAWDALTHPSNLAELELWGSKPQEMNPTAREAAEMTIRHCRKKSGII